MRVSLIGTDLDSWPGVLPLIERVTIRFKSRLSVLNMPMIKRMLCYGVAMSTKQPPQLTNFLIHNIITINFHMLYKTNYRLCSKDVLWVRLTWWRCLFRKRKKKQNKTGHPFTLSTTCSKKSDKSVPNNPTD